MTTPKRRFSKWLWLLVFLPVAFLLFGLVLQAQAKAFLRSDRFRAFLGAKISQSIKAEGAFQPLQWTGTSFYTDGFKATGSEGELELIDARQIRSGINLAGIWERKWLINEVEVERLDLVLANKKERRAFPILKPAKIREPKSASSRDEQMQELRETKPKSEKIVADPKKSGFSLAHWLPNQVEVSKIQVASLRIDGLKLEEPFLLEGVKVEAKQSGKAWSLLATEGTLSAPGRGSIEIEKLPIRYVDDILFITKGTLQVPGGGSLVVDGKLRSGLEPSKRGNEETDLTAKIERLPLGAILPEDWRARWKGVVNAEIEATTNNGAWKVSGPVSVTEGRLEALPILDQVAIFTRTQRFRQINLESLDADVVVENNRVTVSNLQAESPGLLRVTGSFVIENDEILGDFLVGVTPASLRFLPGSQTKVFTLEKDGFLWAPMRVSGPINRPREDLSGRLATAAGQELLDTLQNDPNKFKETIEDGGRSLLDIFTR